MLVGQHLGPFAIDKELGSGAMGSVYRGVYAKTGQRVAIKVMAPGFAASENHAARFEREAAILKQFNHPNIVRLFGVGKYHGTRYYAMEYIEGEALDRTLGRRDKLTWEEVVDFGVQLAAALQHSHDAGVIHRDLKPSNLMILSDGKTLKLTDFGIAKDTDVTALTSANCTVGTAAYMSPEQCKGERDLTAKSDLYSLGIVFYELLTGNKPFEAENAMEMFLKHVNEVPTRASHQPGCMDIPAQLDTLVNQLMEKKPEHRPLNAAMVYNVLNEIREKSEAQQSAGVDAAKKKLLDTPRDQRNINDEDRDAARTLLGGKSRLKRKRKKGKGFFRSVLFQILAITALLGGMGLILWVVFSPPAPEKLYEQAKKLMEAGSVEDWDKAGSERGPLALYMKHHGDRPGAETKQVRQWQEQVEMWQSEQLLQKFLEKRRAKRDSLMERQNEAQEDAFKAITAEDDGKLDEAQRRWDEMTKKYESGSGFTRWGRLAEAHAKIVARALKQDEQWREPPRTSDAERKGLEKDAFEAWQAEGRNAAVASKKFKELKDKCESELKEVAPGKESEARYWLLYATHKLRQLEQSKTEK